MTTPGRFGHNFPAWLYNKRLTLIQSGKFTPAKGGQGNWFFQSVIALK